MPTPDNMFERTPSPSIKRTILENAPGFYSQKSRTTSMSSDKLNEVLPQSFTSSQSIVDKVYSSRDKEDVRTTYKNDADLQFRKTDEIQQTASSTFNKGLINERSSLTPRPQVQISSITETSLHSTRNENHSSMTNESHDQSIHRNISTENEDSVAVNFESKQNGQKSTGSFSDLQERFMDKNLNLEYSSYTEAHEKTKQTADQKSVSEINQYITEV